MTLVPNKARMESIFRSKRIWDTDPDPSIWDPKHSDLDPNPSPRMLFENMDPTRWLNKFKDILSFRDLMII